MPVIFRLVLLVSVLKRVVVFYNEALRNLCKYALCGKLIWALISPAASLFTSINYF